MSSLYLHVPPIGLDSQNFPGFEYMPERPARHCRICGASYQPQLARDPDFNSDPEVQWRVEILLQEWALHHNKRHSDTEHDQFRKSGRFLSPEAAEQLIPKGIIPMQDMSVSEESAHAARLAKRVPTVDVEGTRY